MIHDNICLLYVLLCGNSALYDTSTQPIVLFLFWIGVSASLIAPKYKYVFQIGMVRCNKMSSWDTSALVASYTWELRHPMASVLLYTVPLRGFDMTWKFEGTGGGRRYRNRDYQLTKRNSAFTDMQLLYWGHTLLYRSLLRQLMHQRWISTRSCLRFASLSNEITKISTRSTVPVTSRYLRSSARHQSHYFTGQVSCTWTWQYASTKMVRFAASSNLKLPHFTGALQASRLRDRTHKFNHRTSFLPRPFTFLSLITALFFSVSGFWDKTVFYSDFVCAPRLFASVESTSSIFRLFACRV